MVELIDIKDFSSVVHLDITCKNDNSTEVLYPTLLFEKQLIISKKTGCLIKNVEGVDLSNLEDIRYIIGICGSHNDVLEFTVLSNNIYMDYVLRYDSEDDCYYGVRYKVYPGALKEQCGYVKAVKRSESLDDIGKIYNMIEQYGHNYFYINNSKIVASLLKRNKPTILKHNENIDYTSIKKLFNTKDKVKVNARFTSK